MQRSEVLRTIDGERQYQQNIGESDAHDQWDWLRIADYYLRKAFDAGRAEQGHERMSNVRKAAAVLVAAMEQHGCPPREGYEGQPLQQSERVPDGTYKTKHGDGIISYGNNQLSVSQLKKRMVIFVGTLPDGWELRRPVVNQGGSDAHDSAAMAG